MDKSLTLKMLESYQQSCETDSKLKLSRNAATHNEITDLAMDWNQFRKIDHSFSNTISGEMKITNQKSSGRCWGFAVLNLLESIWAGNTIFGTSSFLKHILCFGIN